MFLALGPLGNNLALWQQLLRRGRVKAETSLAEPRLLLRFQRVLLHLLLRLCAGAQALGRDQAALSRAVPGELDLTDSLLQHTEHGWPVRKIVYFDFCATFIRLMCFILVMKTLIALLLAVGASTAFCQEPPVAPEPPGPGLRTGGPGAFGGGHRDKGAMLPPELKSRMEAARNKAMQDPAIQELQKKAEASMEAFRTAMREAMQKADPGLKDAIQQLRESKGLGKGASAPGN